MAQKVSCVNAACKHHCDGNRCDARVKIGLSGKCESFEKGFVYYIHLVWAMLGDSNFIDAKQITPDVRIGLYYVMKLYHLGFSERMWGSCCFITLHEGEDGPALNAKEIIALKMDMACLGELLEDFKAGKLPGPSSEKQDRAATTETPECDFGWVTPAGDFIASPWGQHEESAEAICTERGFEKDYRAWRDVGEDRILYRDYLIMSRGYCLIHNPSLDGGFIVTHEKALTKKQREFLYDFFIDRGDRMRAEMFFQDD